MNTTKFACGKEPFTLEWASFFTLHGLDPQANPITSSTWEVTGGVKGNEFIDGADTAVFLSGGTVGTLLVAKNTIQVDGGTYQDCRTLYVEIL